MKVCTSCKTEKPLADFYAVSSQNKRSRSACIRCIRQAEKEYGRAKRAAMTPEEKRARTARCLEWRRNNREKDRDWRLRRDYGIGLAEYKAMLEQQGNRCAICSLVEDANYTLHVDHCHDTGRVRGLLCGPCNKLLGMAKDSQSTLLKAAAYLEERK